MRNTKYLFLVFVVIFVFSACNYAEEDFSKMNNDIIPSTANVLENTYTKSQLDEIIVQKSTLDELTKKYSTKYVRQTENGYRVAYYGNDVVAVVTFDKNKANPVGGIFSCAKSSSEYEHLQLECSLDDVRLIDPNGTYLFLYTGRNDVPRMSTHYTSDKYVINITYNESNLITDINVELV